MSLIDESGMKYIRMAHLAILGSHSTNGVAEIHTELLRTHTGRDFAEMFPARFNNKTNGVTPRRWLRLANPALSRAILQAIGTDRITNLKELRRLRPLAADRDIRCRVLEAKREAKVQLLQLARGKLWLEHSIRTPSSIVRSNVSTNINASS